MATYRKPDYTTLVKEAEVFWVLPTIILSLRNNDHVEGEIEDITSKRMKIPS